MIYNTIIDFWLCCCEPSYNLRCKISRMMIRYKLLPEKVEENKALVKAVFAELHTKNPAGIRYASFGFPDGLSFVHIVSLETDGPNPLMSLESFPLFTKEIKDRCEEPPLTMEMEEVGSYNLF